MVDLVLAFLLILAIIFAFLAIEEEKRIYGIIYLAISTIVIGLIFIYLGAIYAGILHLIIYSGLLTVLFASTSNFVESDG